MESSRRSITLLLTAALLVAACSQIRHPLDDSETRPDTQALAIEEAGSTMDLIDESLMGDVPFTEDTWVASDGCATASFAPSQGDVGSVLIRNYPAGDLADVGTTDELIAQYESYWKGEGESVSRNSPNMDPGAVSRVGGIGYELVSLPPQVQLRAFIPCYE